MKHPIERKTLFGQKVWVSHFVVRRANQSLNIIGLVKAGVVMTDEFGTVVTRLAKESLPVHRF